MILVAVVAAVLGLLSVGVHYESLRFVSSWVDTPRISPRQRVALAVVLALVAHFLEVIVFSAGWSALIFSGHVSLSESSPGPADILYFSMITYTALGYGDIVPLGSARLLAGVESLVGLVLIAWTASFTYFEMRRHWEDDDA